MPRRYKMLITKGAEEKLKQYIEGEMENPDSPIYGVVQSVDYPKVESIALLSTAVKGEKEVTVRTKPLVPSLICVKTPMSPTIAMHLEALPEVRYMLKDIDGLIVPMVGLDAEQIEQRPVVEVPAEARCFVGEKQGVAFTVTNGPYSGCWGTLERIEKGKIEVQYICKCQLSNASSIHCTVYELN